MRIAYCHNCDKKWLVGVGRKDVKIADPETAVTSGSPFVSIGRKKNRPETGFDENCPECGEKMEELDV